MKTVTVPVELWEKVKEEITHGHYDFFKQKPTHWQPLPELPKNND